jgi:predicted small lipoprotein YifL
MMGAARLRIGPILLLLAAAGCGQKGPLYLPDKTRTAVPAAPAEPPAAQPPSAQPPSAEPSAMPPPAEPPAPDKRKPATPPGDGGA